ncbi:hypothetical protein ELE66_31270, partial [Klebsiella pneumoniae]|nr:hypothetical protein [Klebsiella pneumoniae]
MHHSNQKWFPAEVADDVRVVRAVGRIARIVRASLIVKVKVRVRVAVVFMRVNVNAAVIAQHAVEDVRSQKDD